MLIAPAVVFLPNSVPWGPHSSSWLGEEIEEKADGALVARCVKDVIEEKLFNRRRDLLTDLSLVFMDTTSLSFYGAGGEKLGKRGHFKDFRPDLAQMVLALVIDTQGRPICTEMVPGNTADANATDFGHDCPRMLRLARLLTRTGNGIPHGCATGARPATGVASRMKSELCLVRC